jgi:hypothetical protein
MRHEIIRLSAVPGPRDYMRSVGMLAVLGGGTVVKLFRGVARWRKRPGPPPRPRAATGRRPFTQAFAERLGSLSQGGATGAVLAGLAPWMHPDWKPAG